MRTDIIIPVWNLLELTKSCIESVLKNTAYPYSLIVIDNGSSLKTKTYLEGLKEKKNLKLTLIRNESNLGFVKAVNQGIKTSSSPYVCLLNNDTQVTQGWLREMVKVAESKEEIGIVNANSNTLACKPRKRQSLEALSKELKTYTGKYSELAWATGFCMLIKRKVIQQVGLFDEVYGMGNFEDADFCKRAQRLGYFCVCAKAAYVYHHERRSFMKLKMFDQDFKRIRKIFNAKWGKQQRILYILTKDSAEFVKKVGEESLTLAREGNAVWIFLKDQDRQKFKKHSNIYIYDLPKSIFNLVSFWRILKRKKRFDKIYVDDRNYRRKLSNFKFFHKAEVIYAE